MDAKFPQFLLNIINPGNNFLLDFCNICKPNKNIQR